MGHYAKVINDMVVAVNVASQEWIDKQPDREAWYETSYNIVGGVYYDHSLGKPHTDQTVIQKTAGRKRKNFAGVGYTYDKQRDAFIPPKPHLSWILNEKTCQWEAPIPYPNDGKQYLWNELHKQWTKVE